MVQKYNYLINVSWKKGRNSDQIVQYTKKRSYTESSAIRVINRDGDNKTPRASTFSAV